MVLVAPGMPNLAGEDRSASLGHVNGYAEGVDGAVFMAGMVSLAFVENGHTGSLCTRRPSLSIRSRRIDNALDMVIPIWQKRGKSPDEVASAVEDRWHIEYPATNNAVPNGGIAALAVWFGNGDFLKTVNLAYSAGDFTDADCNAANAAAVVGAMHGKKCLPAGARCAVGDRLVGHPVGGVRLTPPVNKSISQIRPGGSGQR